MRLVLIIFLLLICTLAKSQTKDPNWTGAANGLVNDSAHRHVMPFATLAVYKITDSSLVSYQLTNNLGEFHFHNLPFDIPLKIIATYVGYHSFTKRFLIKKIDGKIDFQPFNLAMSSNELDEVTVTVHAPLRMHGDTLEFNADAFDMDRNAVGEDLLRKLPGVILWGDGTITVNGRTITSLLVNGKPFFGGDAKLATQNIPKSAINKVQVYRKQVDPSNPLDSIMEINLKLKKNKGFGHFGKISAGYGSGHHFEGDGNLNFFSPLTQLGIAAATNNINKTAKDIATLISNSSYKGIGANIDYQPDFTVHGVNHPTDGGLILQHDFTVEPDKYQTDRLIASYFMNYLNNTVNSNIKTTTALGDNNNQTIDAVKNAKATDFAQNLNLAYKKNKLEYAYSFGAILNTDDNNQRLAQSDSSISSSLGRQSLNKVNSDTHINLKRISINASVVHQKPARGGRRSPGNWMLNYGLEIGSYNSDTSKTASFTNLIDPVSSSYYNRLYKNNGKGFNQSLDARLDDLSNLLLGEYSLLVIGVENNLKTNYQDFHSDVTDLDTLTARYLSNQQLSVNRNYSIIDERPGINISRRFMRILSNRYQKDVLFKATLQGQIYIQKSTSDHSFQDFNQSYRKFIPTVSISYLNNQFGYFQNEWEIGFESTYKYPDINQLFPIVDYSNAYNILTGNASLKPSHKNELSFTFRHTGMQPKNTFDYSINALAGTISNSFAYSNVVDSSGRSTYSFVNLNGFRYANLTGTIKKAYKFSNNQIQLKLAATLNFSKTPGYTQNFNQSSPELNFYDNLSSTTSLSVYYNYSNYITLNITEAVSAYNAKQRGGDNNTDFNNTLQSSQLSASVNCTKRLSISTNITQNNSTATGSDAIHFNIWNASASYRFMQANNLELKFSALDMLHQNTGIINYGNNNILTHGTINVLQQYFIVTISYFLKKFGK